MIRTLVMSSRRGKGYAFSEMPLHEPVEEVARVPGTAGLGWYCTLQALKEGSRCLHGAVVEVAVGQLHARWQRLLAHGEAVVLAGDLDPPRVQFRTGGCAVVPEGHLVRLAPESEAEQLVPEADAEDRHLAE